MTPKPSHSHMKKDSEPEQHEMDSPSPNEEEVFVLSPSRGTTATAEDNSTKTSKNVAPSDIDIGIPKKPESIHTKQEAPPPASPSPSSNSHHSRPRSLSRSRSRASSSALKRSGTGKSERAFQHYRPRVLSTSPSMEPVYIPQYDSVEDLQELVGKHGDVVIDIATTEPDSETIAHEEEFTDDQDLPDMRSLDSSLEDDLSDYDAATEDDDDLGADEEDDRSQSSSNSYKRVKEYVERELNPKVRLRHKLVQRRNSPRNYALPSQIRAAKMEVALSRRKSRLRRAWELARRSKLRRLRREMQDSLEEVQTKIDNMKQAKEKGLIVDEKQYLKCIKKKYWIEKRLKNFGKMDLARTGKESTFWFWRYLRGEPTMKAKNAISWQELKREDRDEIKSLILDLGWAFLSFGMPAYRLDYAISMTSAFYGLDAEINVTPSQFLVSFHDYLLDNDGERVAGTLPDQGLSRNSSTLSFSSMEKEWRRANEYGFNVSDNVTDEEEAFAAMKGANSNSSKDGSVADDRRYYLNNRDQFYKNNALDSDSDSDGTPHKHGRHHHQRETLNEEEEGDDDDDQANLHYAEQGGFKSHSAHQESTGSNAQEDLHQNSKPSSRPPTSDDDEDDPQYARSRHRVSQDGSSQQRSSKDGNHLRIPSGLYAYNLKNKAQRYNHALYDTTEPDDDSPSAMQLRNRRRLSPHESQQVYESEPESGYSAASELRSPVTETHDDTQEATQSSNRKFIKPKRQKERIHKPSQLRNRRPSIVDESDDQLEHQNRNQQAPSTAHSYNRDNASRVSLHRMHPEAEAQTKKIVHSEMSFLMRNSTHFIKVKHMAMNLQKVIKLEELCYLLYHGFISIKEARQRLQSIMKMHHPFDYAPILLICHVLAAVGFSVILQANWGEMVAIIVGSTICTIIDLLLYRVFTIFQKLFLPLGSICAGLVAVLMRFAFLNVVPVNVFLVALCTMINYLPGYGFVISMAELSEKKNEAGLFRISMVAIMMIQMGFGIVVGSSLNAVLLPEESIPEIPYTNPLWAQVIGLIVSTIAWGFSFRIPIQVFTLFFIVISAVFVFFSYYFAAMLTNSLVANLVSGLAVGLSGQVYSWISGHPSIVCTAVIILQCVPGSSGVRAASAYGAGNTMESIEHVLSGAATAISIVIGFMMGRLLIPTQSKSGV